MKINHEIERLVVRWHAPTTERLRAAVNHLYEKRLDHRRWSSWGFDGRERSPEEPHASIVFRPWHLRSMRHFSVCHKNEGIWQIQMSSGGAFSSSLLENVVNRFRQLDFPRTQEAYITYRAKPGGDNGPDSVDGFFIEFGWHTARAPRSYAIRASLSSARASAATRYAFIRSAVEHLGVKDMVQIAGDDKEFTLTAAPGWSLYELETWPDKRNPDFFRTGPFPSFEDVLGRAEHFRAGPLGKQISRLSVSFCVTPELYEAVYEQLNDLADDWHVSFYGSYADGIDPYTADASQSPDGRFPVFMWRQELPEGLICYQAAIVPTPEGRFLEVHSNCGDMKKLLKEAKTAIGMEFTPVEQ